MSATRIRSFQSLAQKVPPFVHVEVWDDNTVWLYTDTKRTRLADFIARAYPDVEDWPNA